MIGDRLDNDIVPAKGFGMKTIWVRQGFAKFQSVKNENEKPNYVVENIGEIINILLN
jgi:ribonucleotide monophosphatase NagD (HAD superfamily)